MNILSDSIGLGRHARPDRVTHRGGSTRASLLVAAALAAASLGAVAQTVAPLSRAEVNSELQRARAAGEIERGMSESFGLVWLQQHHPGASARSKTADEAPGLSREQLRAESIHAGQAGEPDHASAGVKVWRSGRSTQPTNRVDSDH